MCLVAKEVSAEKTRTHQRKARAAAGAAAGTGTAAHQVGPSPELFHAAQIGFHVGLCVGSVLFDGLFLMHFIPARVWIK